jgi:hypothetical protein
VIKGLVAQLSSPDKDFEVFDNGRLPCEIAQGFWAQDLINFLLVLAFSLLSVVKGIFHQLQK